MICEKVKKRIFVLSELYYPEETSTGYFVTKISEGICDNYKVIAICAKPTYIKKNISVSRKELHKKVEIQRVLSSRFDKDQMVGRLLNLLTFTIAASWTFLWRARRGDIVLCLTNPPALPLLIGLCARLKGVASSLLVHDLYPEVLVATGHLKPASLTYRALYWMFGATYRLFDQVIVLGRDMQLAVAQKIGEQAPKPLIIPNWGDIESIQPLERSLNPFALAHGLVDKTVIQFSGNLGRTHDLETVIRAAKKLQTEPDIVFLFVGFGGKSHLVDGTGTGSPPANIRFVPHQPREHLAGMLTCADATVIAFVDEMLGVSVPSRMYNVMAAGVPIIALCNAASELALTVKEQNCGWVLETANVDGLVELVTQIHLDKLAAIASDTKRKGANGRRAAEDIFNEHNVVNQFRKAIGRFNKPSPLRR